MAKIPLIQITRVDLKPLKSSVDRLGDLVEEYLEISGLRRLARDSAEGSAEVALSHSNPGDREKADLLSYINSEGIPVPGGDEAAYFEMPLPDIYQFLEPYRQEGKQ